MASIDVQMGLMLRRIRDLGVSYIEAVRSFTPSAARNSGSGSESESESESKSESSSSDYHVYSESKFIQVTEKCSELN